MGSGSLLKLLVKNFDVLAGPLVALGYPLYASIQAIETRSLSDDHQWLTYWVIHSLIALLELTFIKFIQLLPFWPFVKLVLTCWLVLPHFNGAACVYQKIIRPLFVTRQTVNIWYVPRKKGILVKSDDFLVATDKFIEENGVQAFKKLMNQVERTRKQKDKKHGKFGNAALPTKEMKPNRSIWHSKLLNSGDPEGSNEYTKEWKPSSILTDTKELTSKRSICQSKELKPEKYQDTSNFDLPKERNTNYYLDAGFLKNSSFMIFEEETRSSGGRKFDESSQPWY